VGAEVQLHLFLSSSETKKWRTKFFKLVLWNMNDKVVYTKIMCADKALVIKIEIFRRSLNIRGLVTLYSYTLQMFYLMKKGLLL
jgi:hypothetical protein